MGFSTIGTQPRLKENDYQEHDEIRVTRRTHFDTFSYFRGNKFHKDGDFWNLVSI
jgi:hypothetical protein